jgi:RimJ/RimL family protein N-acetyltransferase
MLAGENIFLRPVEDDDLPLLVEWRNMPEIWRCFLNKFPLNHSDQPEWLKRLRANKERLLLMICRQQDRHPLGTIGFDSIDAVNQNAEIGNVMIGAADMAGKGFAEEAMRLLLEYGFMRLNLHRIFLRVLSRNTRAVKLYKRCGLQLEGTLRQAHFDEGAFHDVLCMGLLRGEFGGR